MTSEEISTRFGVKPITVRVWALKNGVGRKPAPGGIMAYDWTEEDCRRFAERKPPGWEKGKARKSKP